MKILLQALRCKSHDTTGPLAKTLSFSVVHFSIAFTVAYLLTGSVLTGGLIALIEPACNTVAFYFHEKLWLRFGGDSSSHNGKPPESPLANT